MAPTSVPHSVWGKIAPIFTTASRLLDDLDLGAVCGLEEADAPAVGRRQLFQDAHPVGPEPGQRPGVVVGVERDVLEAVALLPVLGVDEGGDVEGHAVQVDAVPPRA